MSEAIHPHFDYVLVSSSCHCNLCSDWRHAKEVYEYFKEKVHDHSRSCMCHDCWLMRRADRGYKAALNRWELYCELSYHASLESFGPALMIWAKNEIARPDITDGWWMGRSVYFPLGSWIERFLNRNGPAYSLSVSGAA